MNKLGLSLIFIGILFSCKDPQPLLPKTGVWRAELITMDNAVLPFNFKLEKDSVGKHFMEIYNADEVIRINDVEVGNDSIKIRMDVYEGYISGTYTPNEIKGEFIKESLDRIVPFTATHGIHERFYADTSIEDVSGVWETEFSANTADSYMAKGIFDQKGNKVSGTFRTTTGDYRYLEGVMDNDSLKLSAFDGAHAFLFMAKVSDSSINGTFYSGNHFKEPFVGRRNAGFELPDEDALTYLKEGYDKLSFSFPDAEGKPISLEDEQFKDKVVVVQIMGTWCPNCMDETKFYVNYLKEHNPIDLKFVGLAFEYAKTEEAAFSGIKRLQERIGVPYPILLAQYGSSNKERAQEKLPMLTHVLSYPTSIFVDKKGTVRKIHTGFNGPATGEKFTLFQKEFNDFVTLLLEEE
ncbi:MAG: TlpA disulfide reductase family protein [Bacteroidota bacterium]